MDTQPATEKTKKPEEPSYELALGSVEINAMPIQGYDGPITVLGRGEDPEAACAQLLKENLLGFDTETRPAFRKGESYLPSLIQLAGAHGVWLFQLDGSIPAPLKDVLSRSTIRKAGVSLSYDLRKLDELDPILPGGFMAIERLAQALRIKNQGLRGLAAAVLGFRISKRAQCSNWSRPDLTEAQIQYAATDAWVSRAIYVELSKRVQARGLSLSELEQEVPLPPPPPPPSERRPPRRRRNDRNDKAPNAETPANSG